MKITILEKMLTDVSKALKSLCPQKKVRYKINTEKNVQPNANRSNSEFCCCLLTRLTF